MSADPIADGLGTAGGFNRYAYVANNPLSLTDPSGYKSAYPKDTLSSDQNPAQPIIVTAPRIRDPLAINARSFGLSGGQGSSFGGIDDPSILQPTTDLPIGDDGLEEIVVSEQSIDRDSSPGPLVASAFLLAQQDNSSRTKRSKRQACLEETYGDIYESAFDISPLSLGSVIGDIAAEHVETLLSRTSKQNLYSLGPRSGYDQFLAGQRQAKTLAQFRRFNAVMAVAGAGAFGFVMGANMYCASQLLVDAP